MTTKTKLTPKQAEIVEKMRQGSILARQTCSLFGHSSYLESPDGVFSRVKNTTVEKMIERKIIKRSAFKKTGIGASEVTYELVEDGR